MPPRILVQFLFRNLGKADLLCVPPPEQVNNQQIEQVQTLLYYGQRKKIVPEAFLPDDYAARKKAGSKQQKIRDEYRRLIAFLKPSPIRSNIPYAALPISALFIVLKSRLI